VELLLLVESDKKVGEPLASALRELGYCVTTAESAEEALRVLNREYGYIVAEVDLPGMSGLDLLEISRCFCETTTVVLMARNPTVRAAVEAFRGGAVDYLCKPFFLQDLYRALCRRARGADVARAARRAYAVAAYRQARLLAGNR